MTNDQTEAKILQLEREAATHEAASSALRRQHSGGYSGAVRKGENMANLMRMAADARRLADELRGQLPERHPMYVEPAWRPARWAA
jgi:hypothetical protein